MAKGRPHPDGASRPQAGDLQAALWALVTAEAHLIVSPGPWAAEGARIVRGLRLCLGTAKTGEGRKSRTEVLSGVAAVLAGEAGQPRAQPAPVLTLCQLVDGAWYGRGPGGERREPAFLAALVSWGCTIAPAFQPGPLPEMEASIRRVTEDPPRTNIAEAIVMAAARASGVKKPSALWDRAKKAEKRRADKP